MHPRGRRVAWRAGVHQNHRAPGPNQNQCRTEACSAATDHHDVVCLHVLRLTAPTQSGNSYSKIDLPEAGEDWQTGMRKCAESTRSVLARHPWAITIMSSRTTPGAANLKHHDSVIAFLRAAGFSIPMAAHAMSLLDSYVHGFALQEATLPLDDAGDIGAATESILQQEPMMSNAFPHLTETAVKHILQPGYAYPNEFQFGLRLILNGLQTALHEASDLEDDKVAWSDHHAQSG